MIISRKRFEAEVQKRVEEEVCKFHERFYRDDHERKMRRMYDAMEQRVIALEKKNGIDHPSHNQIGSALYPL